MSDVVTFYRFVRLEGLPEWRARLEGRARELELRGTILLAAEGINATLTGSAVALAAFTSWLAGHSPFASLDFKYSHANSDASLRVLNQPVFYRLKVRIRPEIVTLGKPHVDPARRTGTHVDAATWNRLLDDPEVLVIDTRNRYEIRVGSFPNAVDPGTRTFRQFPSYVEENLDPARHPRVAMFCTGGIRCEKASAFLLERGFREVCQLDGGVLGYLQTVPAAENRWQGECFVFDQRVSVNPALHEGSCEQCFACRAALAPADRASAEYLPGVSCPHCIDSLNETRRSRFLERRRQVELAAARGRRHLGVAADQGD